MKIFFIASTLPFWYLKINKIKDDDLIVVSNENIEKIFKKIFSEIKGSQILRLQTLDSSKNQILKSSRFIYFHECCWDEVDDLIKRHQKRTKYMPVSHINYFDRVNILLLIKILFQFGVSEINLKIVVKYLYFNILFPNKYKYKLQTNLKDNISFNLVKNLNHKKYNFIEYSNEAHGFKGSEKNISLKNDSIIFLLGNDVLPIKDQMKYYIELIKICKKIGLKVICKAHPRCDVIYDSKLFDENLDPEVPFEVIDIPYRFKVSLFTTSLIFEPSKSISIESLIRNDIPVDKRFNLRSRFLRGFENFNEIKIPQDYLSFSRLIQ